MRSEPITWAGGEHEFALSVPLLLALEDRCNGDGVGLIYKRLSEGLFKVQDVLATVALGLEGGGMKKADAVKLTHTQYEDHGLHALALPAQVVLGLALSGWPKDEPEGEIGVETPKNS